MQLWNKLLNYNKEVYPMHMPGHKGGRYKLIDHLYEVDVTEVADTDHLYDAEGILRESLERLSRAYGTKKSMYLVNGSTVGILSAIGGVTKVDDEVLVARNCHQSVYNALTMFDVKPTYIYPKLSQWGLVGGIDLGQLSKTLTDNPRIVAFVMTSPTYDGFISNIEEIQKVCRRYNVILIVDEAHGAHLPYSNELPDSALAFGADIVIHSMHKTLPTFTGSGLLHMNLPDDLEEQVFKMLQKLQTSSPSYIMMAQMDACVEQLYNNDKVWKKLLKDVALVEKRARKLKKLYMLSEYRNSEEGIVAKDPLKNVVVTRNASINGQGLADRLRKDYNYQLEMASELHSLAIFTVADKTKALNGYLTALKAMDKKIEGAKGAKQTYGIQKQAEMVLRPYSADQKESESIALEAAVGRVSAAMITPYPPGIPVVVTGERMTPALVKQIKGWLDIGVDVLGVTKGCVKVVSDNLVGIKDYS